MTTVTVRYGGQRLTLLCDFVVLEYCNFYPLFLFCSLNQDPGSYNSLPHAIVANLAAFFELWDAFMLHWVKSSQVTLTDDNVHEVSRGFKLLLLQLFRIQNSGGASLFLVPWTLK